MVRLIYCEMLGHSVRFGYVKAMQCTQKRDALLKRTGEQSIGKLTWKVYLACSLFLPDHRELTILITSSMLRVLFPN